MARAVKLQRELNSPPSRQITIWLNVFKAPKEESWCYWRLHYGGHLISLISWCERKRNRLPSSCRKIESFGQHKSIMRFSGGRVLRQRAQGHAIEPGIGFLAHWARVVRRAPHRPADNSP